MGRLDLPDVRRDEDDWPPPVAERTVAWWRAAHAGGMSAAAVDAVLKEHGVYADPAALGVTPLRPATRALTTRQLEVLELIAEGHTNGQIATALSVSVETVKAHVKHVIAALHANDRTHAAVVGVRQHLIA